MSLHFRHAALIGKYQSHGIQHVLEEVAQFLMRLGLQVSLDQETAVNTGLAQYPALTHSEMGRQCDVAVVLGGDGTMLSTARQLAQFDLPLIGINQGRLGFMADVSFSEFAQALEPMIQGVLEEERRTILEGKVWRDGHKILDGFAVNDVVVSRNATAGMVELKVDIEGDLIGNFRADGLIVASPTGSTAYALSAGGPILHPSIPAWVMVPIAPHDLSNRPIVLPDTGEVCIEVVGGRDTCVSFDMQSVANLLVGDQILIRRWPHRVRFLHPLGWSYYDTLRRKLHWNAGVVS
jgi:NAD+ kinase